MTPLLMANMQVMQEQNAKIDKMAIRIDDAETWTAEAEAAIQQMVQDLQTLVDKVNDLESRAR